MSNRPLLATKNLTRDFGGGRGAIDINLTISPGEIIGFIGPNGAGKTTTLRLIMGFALADAGEVKLFGQSVTTPDDRIKLMHRLGFLPGEVNLYPNMNAYDLFVYSSKLYGRSWTREALELAGILELDTTRKLKYLSLGNRKKAGVILSLMHSPDLILLDEPTNGLDPLIQNKVLTILQDRAKAGAGILLSSHVLSEVQQICDQVVMIKEGKIILSDKTSRILSQAFRRFIAPELPSKLWNVLKTHPEVRSATKHGTDYVFYVNETKPIIDLLTQSKIYDFYIERPNLEDMFLEEYK